MKPFNYLVVMTVAVVMATAEYDFKFCRKYLDSYQASDQEGKKANFYDNVYVFMEYKNLINNTAYFIDADYSQQTENAYFKIRVLNAQIEYWVDAATDEIMTGPTSNSTCQDAKLDMSTIGFDLGITKDATGDIQLNTPEVALGWHRKYQNESKYLGPDLSRGIKCDRWMICSYNPDTQVTSVTDWHVVDPDVTLLPVVSGPLTNVAILPVSAHVYGRNKTDPLNPQDFEMSMDFTFYDTINPNGTVFRVPPAMLCASKPSEQIPLPATPTYFQFKGEQITITNTNSQNPNPANVVYTVEKYMHALNMFQQDIISRAPSGSTNEISYQRTINDYNTGLAFYSNIVAGSCYGNAIDPSGIDTTTGNDGYVKLRTFQQFFDLDSSKYQYMGVHTMRGIDCDTWSARFNDQNPAHEQNALYTWYFANPQWLKNHYFENWTNPFPVTLEIQDSTKYIQFNIYEYDVLDDITIPDISLCMDPTFTYTIEMFVRATFSTLQTFTMKNVRNGIYVTLMTVTKVNSLMRISHLDIQPAGNNETSIKFKLFDLRYLHVTGDIKNFTYGPTNLEILNQLIVAANASELYIEVFYPNNSSMSELFYIRSDAVGIFKNGQFYPGNSSVLTASQSNSPPTSSGFSSGSMAGIAFGMLILGIVVGIGVIFGLRRFKGFKGFKREVEIDKKQLDHESET